MPVHSKGLQALSLTCRLAVGAMFLAAGLLKLQDPLVFSAAVEKFGLPVGPGGIAWLAHAVPWMEALTGFGLVLGILPRGAALAAATLLLAFMAGIASLLVRGVDVACPCFGQLSFLCEGPLGLCHLIRNAAFAAAALVVVRFGPGPLALWRERSKALGCGI